MSFRGSGATEESLRRNRLKILRFALNDKTGFVYSLNKKKTREGLFLFLLSDAFLRELAVINIGIDAVLFNKRLMVTGFHYITVVHDQNTIRVINC